MSAVAPPRDLLTATVRFARALREGGVPLTPVEAIDATRALEVIDLGDRADLYLALRSILISRPEDHRLFDELFDRHWSAAAVQAGAEDPSAPGDAGPKQQIPAPGLPPLRSAPSLQQWLRQDGAEEEETLELPLMSAQESLAQKDFSTFAAAELEEVTRVARRIARRLANRPSRRWKPARRGSRISPRRTVRRSLRTSGETVTLAYQERKRKKAKLVVLCDVSGSMDVYSRLLLQFLYAVQNAFSRVETFVFSTRLRRATDQLAGDSYREALNRLSRTVNEWSGGTRIGASLASFNREWGHLVDRRTLVVILSDGWDTGEPEELGAEMLRLHRAAAKVIWLNPLLGSPSYQPLTRGIQAALPHVDVFAPAHNLASLQALVRHLVL